MKNAVVIGASGLIGKECLQQLSHQGSYDKVYAFVRQPLENQPENTEVIITDFNNLQVLFKKCQPRDVFCCLGSTMKKAGSKDKFYYVDHDLVLDVARAACSQGATHFLFVSAIGSNPKSKIFYNRVKGETENDSAKIPFRSLSIFRPSLLLGSRSEFRFTEKLFTILSKVFMPIFSGNLKKYRPVQASHVARSMLALATNAERGIRVIETDEIEDIVGRRKESRPEVSLEAVEQSNV